MNTKQITIRVPATSANLGPGFDTLGLALQLYNSVTISAANLENRVLERVQISGVGAGILTTDESNLAYSSAQLLFNFLGVRADFVLQMHNEIPLSRGLGSSAAAIIGGLVAANEWARLHFDKSASNEEILNLATQLEGHPDNAAAALLGGFVASAVGENRAETQTENSFSNATNHGENSEKVRAFAVQVPLKNAPSFAVWIPDEPLPTKEARAVVPTQLSRADAVFNISRAALLVAALSVGDENALRESLHDKIHQNQRAPLVRGYAEITSVAMESGAIGATLSGAGSTILLWSPRESSTRNRIENAVKTLATQNDFSGSFLWLAVDENGAQIVE